MAKTENRKKDITKNVSSSRKRSYKKNGNDEMGKLELGENDEIREDDELRKRKKRKKISQRYRSPDSKKPLSGMTISVSTLSDKKKACSTDYNDTEAAPNSYNEVCRSCRELGADVTDLVCKRVDVLVCSEAAVRQATQRVRKAIKRNKPLVSITWLEHCRRQGRKVDLEEYRLDKKANHSIRKREDRLVDEELILGGSELEAVPDSGWSETKDLGCCCVCHENGTTDDCPWCIDCKYK